MGIHYELRATLLVDGIRVDASTPEMLGSDCLTWFYTRQEAQQAIDDAIADEASSLRSCGLPDSLEYAVIEVSNDEH